MKAIITKYHGPTNAKGSRVSASDDDRHRVILSWDHALNALENHQAAAKALCTKLNWHGELVTGVLRHSYVHVFKEKSESFTVKKASVT